MTAYVVSCASVKKSVTIANNWMVLLLCKSEKNNGEDMSLASNRIVCIDTELRAWMGNRAKKFGHIRFSLPGAK